jgi:2-oxo-4-hydroxy-4-carboxy--5-ureidoimidazoline (OHCU) decarboxylase
VTPRYTDEDLLDAMRSFAAEHDGRPPTAPTYARRFGSWNAAIAAAGFDPRFRRRSDEELLDELRSLVETAGEHPTEAAVRDHPDMANSSTYKARFGSWTEALAAAGLAAFDS